MKNFLKYIALMVIGLIFMFFGIQILIASFSLQDPFSFVLTFFASNFIILISVALMVGFTIRRIHQRRAVQTYPISSSIATGSPENSPMEMDRNILNSPDHKEYN